MTSANFRNRKCASQSSDVAKAKHARGFNVAVLLIFFGPNAWAVDGVGLLDTFPGLGTALWAVLIIIACAFGFKMVALKNGESREKTLWYLGIGGVLVMAAPFVYQYLGDSHAARLCNSEATASIFVPPEQWLANQKNLTPMDQPRVLIESRRRTPLSFGVWEEANHLVDPISSTVLIASRVYGTRRSHLEKCGASESYRRARSEYSKLAHIDFQEPQ